MKCAIVSGSTGLVGSALVKFLLSKKIKVLCLGRKKLSSTDLINKFGQKVEYLVISMENINSLPDKIKKTNFNLLENCVFFSLAWSGNQLLTDGNFEKQFMNSIHTSQALKISKQIGCQKFINCGTIQETITELILDGNSYLNNSQLDYSISKMASRDMCTILGYLEQIDYIHTRLSVPIDPKAINGGYINKTLSNIMNNKEYCKPTNNQQFDIVHIDDISNAYYLLGKYGQNKADYYIGTSNSTTLNQYFEFAKKFKQGIFDNKNFDFNSHKIFKIDNLISDTGFVLKNSYLDILKNFEKA